NAMERVALLADRDEITPAMLGFLLPGDVGDAANPGEATGVGSLEDALRGRIEAALHATGGNSQRTAAALGAPGWTSTRSGVVMRRARERRGPRASRTRPRPRNGSVLSWRSCV